jgi:hypothetical protein
LWDITLALCILHIPFLLGLLFNLEEGSDVFLQKCLCLAMPDIENIKGLNLAVIKLTTFQVTKLPL